MKDSFRKRFYRYYILCLAGARKEPFFKMSNPLYRQRSYSMPNEIKEKCQGSLSNNNLKLTSLRNCLWPLNVPKTLSRESRLAGNLRGLKLEDYFPNTAQVGMDLNFVKFESLSQNLSLASPRSNNISNQNLQSKQTRSAYLPWIEEEALRINCEPDDDPMHSAYTMPASNTSGSSQHSTWTSSMPEENMSGRNFQESDPEYFANNQITSSQKTYVDLESVTSMTESSWLKQNGEMSSRESAGMFLQANTILRQIKPTSECDAASTRRKRNNDASRRSRAQKKFKFRQIEENIQQLQFSNNRLRKVICGLDVAIIEAKNILSIHCSTLPNTLA